jgi:hypothetical protein
MSYRSNTQDSTKKWLLAVGAAGLISAAAAAAYFLVGAFAVLVLAETCF